MACELEAVLEAGHASREGALCVQAVFRLLDVLTKWVAEARKDAAGAPLYVLCVRRDGSTRASCCSGACLYILLLLCEVPVRPGCTAVGASQAECG